jgi:hypothetical protein
MRLAVRSDTPIARLDIAQPLRRQVRAGFAWPNDFPIAFV